MKDLVSQTFGLMFLYVLLFLNISYLTEFFVVLHAIIVIVVVIGLILLVFNLDIIDDTKEVKYHNGYKLMTSVVSNYGMYIVYDHFNYPNMRDLILLYLICLSFFICFLIITNRTTLVWKLHE